MSRKRRMFDIDMPAEDPVPDVPAGPRISSLDAPRRGPMASAVRETADSLRERAAAEAAIREENDALAHEYVAARAEGLVLRRLALEDVMTERLARDRRRVEIDGDLRELMASIREVGLSNPIHVVPAAGNTFELVQGLRRLTAYRALRDETGDPRYVEVPAVVLDPKEGLSELYRRMVDENLVRKDISFAEMAALARAYAEDPNTEAATLDQAVSVLYASAAKQKRSYIRAFAAMLAVLEKSLSFPEAIPRALGLAVRKRMEEAPHSVAALSGALAPLTDAEAELGVLRDYAGQGAPVPEDRFPAGNPDGPKAGGKPRKARTTFQVEGPEGPAKCTASPGRLEIRTEMDFTALDRRRLEDALRRFMADL